MPAREKDACRTYQDQSVWAPSHYLGRAFQLINWPSQQALCSRLLKMSSISMQTLISYVVILHQQWAEYHPVLIIYFQSDHLTIWADPENCSLVHLLQNQNVKISMPTLCSSKCWMATVKHLKLNPLRLIPLKLVLGSMYIRTCFATEQRL